MTQHTQSEWMTPIQFEEEFQIKRSTQRFWRSTGKHGFDRLAVKVGGAIRYKRLEVLQWISDCQK